MNSSSIESLAKLCNENDIKAISKAIPNFRIVLSSLKMKDRRRSSEDNIGWEVGDIVWANLSGYRFWPALIGTTPQPDGKFNSNLKKIVKSFGKFRMIFVAISLEKQVHCVFLHSNGQSAKVGKKNCVIAFNGLADFQMKCHVS